MFDDLPLFLVRLGLGFVLGVALGFVARRGRFCTLGAIEDAVYANDTRRLRSWILAIGVAIIGVHALELWGGLDLTRSIYLGARLEWGALIIGGFLFGIGMALNGTCGFGTLRQLGGGDLKALISFLVIGVVAMMTLRGLTGIARISLTDPLSLQLPQSFSQRLPEMAGLARRERIGPGDGDRRGDRRLRFFSSRLPHDVALRRDRRRHRRADRRRLVGDRNRGL